MIPRLLSWVDLPYRTGAAVHAELYHSGMRRSGILPRFTVAVGALHFGGAGKTPLSLALADRGSAILLRGYGGKGRGSRVVVAEDGLDLPPWDRIIRFDGRRIRAQDCSAELGDEAALIAAMKPGIPVGVGGDRLASAERVLADHAVQRFVLDDAFSHHRVRKDVELVCLPVRNGADGVQLAPGPFREGLAALGRADRVVLMADGTRPFDTVEMDRLMKNIRFSGPWAVARKVVRRLFSYPGGASVEADQLSGKKGVLVSAIGRPASFHRVVRTDLAIEEVGRLERRDHHRFRPGELARAERLAATSGADVILTTLKDAMRLPAAWRPSAPWLVAEPEISWDLGCDELKRSVRQT